MRADFYLLSSSQDTHTFVCRLLQKIVLQKKTVFVLTNSEEESKKLDAMLWTFDDISFIPHAFLNEEVNPAISIYLNHKKSDIAFDVLCNLTSLFQKDEIKQFSRVVEIVPYEEALIAKARKKYQLYQQQQFELHTHKI